MLLGGDVEGMMRHSADYLELFSIVVVAWQWLAQAAVATERLGGEVSDEDRAFYEGKRAAAQYWFATEVPRVGPLAELCGGDDDSYARMRADWF